MSAKSRVPNSSKKNIFTVDGYTSDTVDSLEGKNLLVDPLKIDGFAQQVAWLSKLTMPNEDITCKLDTGAEANVLPTQIGCQTTNPTNCYLTNSIWWFSHQPH